MKLEQDINPVGGFNGFNASSNHKLQHHHGQPNEAQRYGQINPKPSSGLGRMQNHHQ